ncbi:MAG: Asp-tRNA(Asn)/Glu-tRNA(Gln) amidotransferase subunit GatB [Planctomycetes bacterium]|nr:Asp-tRNA(Asn)/Glu-tRNA(Gln) amidotransferase subunit GatB [Planctomycetota bacterium]
MATDTTKDYTVVIGLEVHVQLLTKTKVFCGCVNLFNPENPNVQTCPVCLGMPGVLPVMNREAFRLALKTALALNCRIARFTKWDRKQYYYPDLPKNYQISQYDLPFSHDGWLEVASDEEFSEKRRIGIIRVHLEEDAGKNLHDETGRGTDSRVDLNRAGTPLLEIVSKPDIRSPAEARRYLEELKLLLTYLGVSDCNMQEGSLRCDANINLHLQEGDETIATPIVEVKNLNSFRAVELALQYEVGRQLDEFRSTGHRLGDVPKQTRGWDEKREITFGQRGKEEASDYRYFPDPDLVPVTVSDKLLEEIRGELCELPAARRERFRQQYGLSQYDASVIIDQGRRFADYFERVAQECEDGKQAANWVTQDVLREMNQRKVDIDKFPISADDLAFLLKKISARELTTKSARDVFAELLAGADSGTPPSAGRIDQIINERGLALVSDAGQLEGVITAVIARNEKAANDFRNGKQAAIGRLIGEVMREVKGADPKLVRQMLIEKIVGSEEA